MSNNTCYETVEMADGSFCLCLCTFEMRGGDLRITGVVREVGLRRVAPGSSLLSQEETAAAVEAGLQKADDIMKEIYG